MAHIINFAGAAEYGKDYICKELIAHFTKEGYKCQKLAYADYLKYIAKQYFNWNGEKDEEGRHLLQYIGTDIIRHKNPNFWVDTVRMLVDNVFYDCNYIFISDCRFPNELSWSNTNHLVTNIKIIRLNGDGSPFENSLTYEQRQHPSETALSNSKFDYTFYNIVGHEDLGKPTRNLDRLIEFIQVDSLVQLSEF